MRLVTRADFDGLVCGALITKMEEIDSYLFVEPKFLQDGEVDIRKGDVIANLPYHPSCTLWFDHHITNHATGFDRPIVPGRGGFRLAPSAARVVHEYYVETSDPQDPKNAERIAYLKCERIRYLLEETDKIDAGKLTPQDVLSPAGYVLISMTTDGKRPEHRPYWLRVIGLLRDATLDETLRDQEVDPRCREVLNAQERLKEILLQRASLIGNVIFLDMRGIRDVPEGNRFLLYTLFPNSNISLRVSDDAQRPNMTAISVGYNIFNTTSRVNVGALMEKHGGGGHTVVGSCRVPDSAAEKSITEILEAIKE